MARALVLCEGDHRDGPYGVDVLARQGVDLCGVNPTHGRVLSKLRDVVEHRSGLRWEQALRAAPMAHRSDLVLGLLEPSTDAALLLKARGVGPYARTPLALVSCWLTQWLREAGPQRRAELVRRYSAADLLLVLSRNQVPELAAAGLDPSKIAAVPYGCAPSLFDGPPLDRDLDVVAAGFDRGRDYATFFAGVGGLDTTVHLLCQPANLEGVRVPPNVVVHGVVPYEQYRRVLRRAKVVAVPTRELAYPCGQSVALDAASAGAVVAFTRTAALGEYLDETCAAPVEVGDSRGWEDTMRALLAQDERRAELAAAGRLRVRQTFTVEHMWRAVLEALRERDLLPAG